MNTQKNIRLLLAICIFLTACGKKETITILETKYLPADQKPNNDQESDFDLFNQITANQQTNLPALDAMSALYKMEKLNIADMSNEQLLTASEEVASIWKSRKRELILQNTKLINAKGLLKNSIIEDISSQQYINSFAFEVSYKIANRIQTQAYENILEIYKKSISENTKIIAEAILSEQNKKSPQSLNSLLKIKSEDNDSRRIKMVIEWLQRNDKILLAYNVKDQDAVKFTIYSNVANYIATKLKDTVEFKKIDSAISDFNIINTKIQEVIVLNQALKTNIQQLKADAQSTFSNAQSIAESTAKLIKEAQKMPMSDAAKNAGIRMLGDMMQGDFQTKIDAVSKQELQINGFFNHQIEIKNNIQKFSESSQRMANSVDNLVNTTRAVSKVLNIKLNSDCEKVLNTATKVASVVKEISTAAKLISTQSFTSAITSFATGGGFMAISALAGGVGGMGGGPDPAIMSALADIKKELNEIKEMQKTIIEQQKRTMEMIVQVADLIKAQHIEEMIALNSIEEQVDSIKETVDSMDLRTFNNCISFLPEQLSKQNFTNNFVSLDTLERNKTQLKIQTSSIENLQNFYLSARKSSYELCQTELESVLFDIQRISRSQDGKSLGGYAIKKHLYLPALQYFITNQKGHKNQSIEDLALHLPQKDFNAGYEVKSSLTRNELGMDAKAMLGIHISPSKLEKFATTILLLYPYLNLSHTDDIYKNRIVYLQEINSTHNLERYRKILSQALKLTQVAIAQESLLSGEPMLESLAKDWPRIISQKTDCDADFKPNSGQSQSFCFIKKNSLMMNNLVRFYFYKQFQGKFPAELKEAYLTGNTNTVGIYLGLNQSEIGRLKYKEDKFYLSLDEITQSEFELPSWEDLQKTQINYTNSMLMLINLQSKIAEELIKLESSILNEKQKQAVVLSILR